MHPQFYYEKFKTQESAKLSVINYSAFYNERPFFVDHYKISLGL